MPHALRRTDTGDEELTNLKMMIGYGRRPTPVLPQESATASASASGIMLSVISFSGFFTGLAFGKLPDGRISSRRQYQIASALLAIGVLFFIVADGLLVALLSSAMIGVGMTPMFIASYMMVDNYFETSDHVEINAALGSSFNIGNGLASLTCGFALAAFASGHAFLALAAITTLFATAAVFLPRPSVGKKSQ